MKSKDLERMRSEYAAREKRLAGSDRYSLFNQAHFFMVQQRMRKTIQVLRMHGYESLADHDILEIGCGTGQKLLEYHALGAALPRLHGCDLLLERLDEARMNNPALSLVCSDGQDLPYPSRSFDLVLQYTVFSSILDADIREAVASEMVRVLRRDGMILWYDFWLNPVNPRTRGIRPAEIRSLFPGCRYEFHRITLAPPVARRLVPLSWLLSTMLEKLVLFNSHYLVSIQAG